MRPSNKAVVHHETGWAVTLREDIEARSTAGRSASTASRSTRTRCSRRAPAVFESQRHVEADLLRPGPRLRGASARHREADRRRARISTSSSTCTISRAASRRLDRVGDRSLVQQGAGHARSDHRDGRRRLRGDADRRRPGTAQRGRDGQRRDAARGPGSRTFRRTPRTGRSPRSRRCPKRSRSTGSRRTCTCAART